MKASTALLTAALFSSTFAAQAVVHVEPECDVNLDGNIRLHQGNVDISTSDGTRIRITPEYAVSVNGEWQDLSAREQAHAEEYYKAINTAVPMAVDIATDGIAIASEAISEVFSQLLGDGDPLVADSQTLFDELSTNINEHFYDEQGAFTISSSNMDGDGWFSDQWETEFESKVESIVERAIGQIMVNVGTQLLFGDEDAATVMEQFEDFDTTFEARIEEKASALEFKADQLCAVLKEADKAENALQASLSSLSDLNLIQLDYDEEDKM